MTTPLRIDRPLTEDEKTLLCWLGTRALVDQLGCTEDVAVTSLDAYATCGLVHYQADEYRAFLDIDGHRIVGTTRDFLAFAAMVYQETE